MRKCAGVRLGEIRGIRGVFALFFPLSPSAAHRPKNATDFTDSTDLRGEDQAIFPVNRDKVAA
jgi:hypothetical protein